MKNPKVISVVERGKHYASNPMEGAILPIPPSKELFEALMDIHSSLYRSLRKQPSNCLSIM